MLFRPARHAFLQRRGNAALSAGTRIKWIQHSCPSRLCCSMRGWGVFIQYYSLPGKPHAWLCLSIIWSSETFLFLTLSAFHITLYWTLFLRGGVRCHLPHPAPAGWISIAGATFSATAVQTGHMHVTPAPPFLQVLNSCMFSAPAAVLPAALWALTSVRLYFQPVDERRHRQPWLEIERATLYPIRGVYYKRRVLSSVCQEKSLPNANISWKKSCFSDYHQ